MNPGHDLMAGIERISEKNDQQVLESHFKLRSKSMRLIVAFVA